MKPTSTKHNRVDEAPTTMSGNMPWHHRNTFPHSRRLRWILSATPLSAIGVVLIAAGAVWSGIAVIAAALAFYRWWEFRRR
jgi:hypothetical protein